MSMRESFGSYEARGTSALELLVIIWALNIRMYLPIMHTVFAMVMKSFGA